MYMYMCIYLSIYQKMELCSEDPLPITISVPKVSPVVTDLPRILFFISEIQ